MSLDECSDSDTTQQQVEAVRLTVSATPFTFVVDKELSVRRCYDRRGI